MAFRIAELRRRDIRRDVERIRDHDEDGIRRVLDDLCHDFAHDLRVLARERQALMAHARHDARTRRADDDIRVLPAARMDVHARIEVSRERVHHIECLAVRDFLPNIDADDFRCEVQCDGLREHSGTDMAEAEDGEFLSTFHEKNLSSNL